MTTQPTDEHPNPRPWLLPLVVGLCLIAAVAGGVLLARHRPPANVTQAKPTPQPTAPAPSNSNSPLHVSLSTDKASYRTGDTIVFSSEVRNTSSQPYDTQFTSTCTQGWLYIDGHRTQTGRVCGQSITKVHLDPQQSRQYTYKFTIVGNLNQSAGPGNIDYEGEILLHPQRHTAYLDWQHTASSSVTFDVQ